jgi:NADPH2:quinone reductase
MRAAIAEGGRIEIRDVPRPEPGAGELLVRVRAAGLNAADRLLVAGRYLVGASVRPPEPSAPGPVPVGAEMAGEVEAVGAGVSGYAVGDRVMAMCRGAFAEYALADTARTMPVPAGVDWTTAAAVPLTFVTAHDAIATAGRLAPGESVLVNAASSGVGVASVQVARLLGAGTVIAASTSPDKYEKLRAAGVVADVELDAGAGDLAEQVLAATGGRGVDVVVDSVGAAAFPANLAAAALGARIVSVGRLGGSVAAVDLDELSRKRVSVVGVTFRTRSRQQAADVFGAAGAVLGPALADGRLTVLVDRTFDLAEAAAAEDYLGTGTHIGKVVLVVDRA